MKRNSSEAVASLNAHAILSSAYFIHSLIDHTTSLLGTSASLGRHLDFIFSSADLTASTSLNMGVPIAPGQKPSEVLELFVS